MSAFTLPQRKALSIVPHITGAMSIAGSGFILMEILRDRKKLGQVYHRLILGMTTVNILATALGAFLSTWPIPSSEDVYGASGNQATCRMQGFFLTLGVSVPFYNLALAVYYLLVIGYSRKERQLKVLERWMHFLALSWGFGVAIAGLFLDLYHNAKLWCWIAPPPCDDDAGIFFCHPEDNNHDIYRWAFFGIPMWLVIFAITIIMSIVYYRVRRQELISRKWRRGSEGTAKKLTKQVAAQATWYVGAFYVTWIFPTIARAMEAFGTPVPYTIAILAATLVPLQGFLNFWIYVRPRYERFRRQHPEWSLVSVLKEAILKTICVCKRDVADDMEDDMNPARKYGAVLMTTAPGVNTLSSVVTSAKQAAPEESKIYAEAEAKTEDR